MKTERQLLKITGVTQVNRWVRRFRLEPARDGERLAPFEPGQYLNLFYEIDGTATSRPYSIASSPKDAENGFYELYIHGGGTFTAPWLFEHGAVGTALWASYPEGDFHYQPGRDAPKVIGISGGMSVTPLCSMARAVADGTLDVDLTLFCGWDTKEEVLCREEFSDCAARCPRFHVVTTVAEGGLPGDEQGYVTLNMIRRHTDPRDASFFLCGPAVMYQSLARELAPLRIPKERYHLELPGEAGVMTNWEEPFGGKEERFSLTVIHRGERRTIPLNSRETVLVAMERAGLPVEARCRSGHCGYCRSRLESGRVFVPDRWEERTEEEKKRGLIHPCCSFPRSDLVLNTGWE